MRKITVREYDAQGRMVKETITEDNHYPTAYPYWGINPAPYYPPHVWATAPNRTAGGAGVSHTNSATMHGLYKGFTGGTDTPKLKD